MTRHRLMSILRFDGIALLVCAAGALLLYTGSSKLLGPSTFAETIASHGLIPKDLSPHIAWGVIAMELGVGASVLWLILAENRLRAAAIATAIVFAAFAWYAGAMTLFPPPEPTSCGCSGSAAAEPADWRQLTGRNACAAALLFLAAPIAGRSLRATPSQPPESTPSQS